MARIGSEINKSDLAALIVEVLDKTLPIPNAPPVTKTTLSRRLGYRAALSIIEAITNFSPMLKIAPGASPRQLRRLSLDLGQMICE
jgi:hypothetical protein